MIWTAFLARGVDGAIDGGKDGACVIEEDAPGRKQRHAAGCAREERSPDQLQMAIPEKPTGAPLLDGRMVRSGASDPEAVRE